MKHFLALLLLVTGSIALHASEQPEVIHGHTLPPEPDPVVNNSTLLGIDVNNNDVRDDVEIWIYKTYKDKHPIYVDISMQAARGYKKALQMPQAAREIYKEVNSALYCEFYYKDYADIFNDPMLINQYDYLVGYDLREEIYLNTPARLKAYRQYSNALSGGSYPLLKLENTKPFVISIPVCMKSRLKKIFVKSRGQTRENAFGWKGFFQSPNRYEVMIS